MTIVEPEKDRLKQDVKFLLTRSMEAGSVTFGDSERFVGVSSNAMVRAAYEGGWPSREEYPADMSDLAACERTFEMAPRHRRNVMEAVLMAYKKHLEEKLHAA